MQFPSKYRGISETIVSATRLITIRAKTDTFPSSPIKNKHAPGKISSRRVYSWKSHLRAMFLRGEICKIVIFPTFGLFEGGFGHGTPGSVNFHIDVDLRYSIGFLETRRGSKRVKDVGQHLCVMEAHPSARGVWYVPSAQASFLSTTNPLRLALRARCKCVDSCAQN